MYKHGWIKALILAGLLMLPSASAMAQQATGQQQLIVEVIVIPCLPGMKPEECGVKVSANGGTLTFTNPAGVDITLTPGKDSSLDLQP